MIVKTCFETDWGHLCC